MYEFQIQKQLVEMVHYETEETTIQKLNTYKFDSRPSVTVILDEVEDDVETIYVEEYAVNPNPPPPYENHHFTNNTYNTQSEHVTACNYEHILLDKLAKNIISIIATQNSVISNKCDYITFINFKHNVFRQSEKFVADIFLPKTNDHTFEERFLKDTLNLAMYEKCETNHSQVKFLLSEMINAVRQRNKQRKTNNSNPLIAQMLQSPDVILNPGMTSYCQNKTSNKEIESKRKKKTSEKVSPVYESIMNDLLAYPQQSKEIVSSNNKEVVCDLSIEKPISPDSTTVDNNQQQPFFSPTISFVTSLNPERARVSDGNCMLCSKVTKKLCIGCLTRYYCSLECQVADWPRHRYECAPPK